MPHVKTERGTCQVSSPFLNPTSAFYHCAFPGKIKTEIKEETPSAQKNEEVEVFKLHHAQIQSMISLQKQLATVVILPHPEVPRFREIP